MSSQDNVGTPGIAWKSMCQQWDLIHDLLGGTLVMRAAGTKWLPIEPEEKQEQYNIRLSRSILYDAYKSTKKKLSAKPFCRPIQITGTLKNQLASIENDVDKTRRTLTQFGKELFGFAIDYGLTHILIDYPSLSGNETKEDIVKQGARPVFLHVTPPMLIGWKSQTLPGGGIELTEIRIKESRTEPDGLYAEKEVEYIRVITQTTWQLWKEEDSAQDGYIQIANGTHTFGAVPLVTIYLDREGFMTGNPCMESLAWLNLAHWQSQSDQRNVLRFARVGILFGSGFSDEEIKKLVISPNHLTKSTNPDAKLSYVEPQGKSIEAGRQDLLDLEDRMERLGMQPLTEKSGDATATAKTLDEAKSDSDIQEWVRSIEAGITFAYQLAAQWEQTTLPTNFKVDIFNDFTLSIKSSTDMDQMQAMRDRVDLSRETFLKEVKRRGVLSENIDIAEELARVKKEKSQEQEKVLTNQPVNVQ